MNNMLVIELCMGSSCFSRGNKNTLETIKQYIEQKEIADKIQIKGSLCKEQCAKGPNITINGITYNNVVPENVIDLLNLHLKEKI